MLLQKHVIDLIDKYNGYNDYIKERSALYSSVRRTLIVREGGAVSPREIFQMATDRFRHFFEEEEIIKLKIENYKKLTYTLYLNIVYSMLFLMSHEVWTDSS